MIELARMLHEAEKQQKKEEKTYVKALLSYHEGRFKLAARLFSRLSSPDSVYMSILANAQAGNTKQALQKLDIYQHIIFSWPHSDEREEAVKRIEELKNLL